MRLTASLTIALALVVAGAQPSASTGVADTAARGRQHAFDIVAAATAAIYRTIDDATADAYVARTLLAGTSPVGRSEPCMAADNRVSFRPSALANVPFSDASIDQRRRLVRTLGTYVSVLATSRADSTGVNSAIARAEFTRAAAALKAVADRHSAGDLFIDERAGRLAAIASGWQTARDERTRGSVASEATVLVGKLVGILRDDVAARRKEALAATDVASKLWSTYRAVARDGRVRGRTVLVPCGAPVVLGDDRSPDANAVIRFDEQHGSNAVLSHASVALARKHALQRLDFNGFFDALLEMNRDVAVSYSAAHEAALYSALTKLATTAATVENFPNADASRPKFNGVVRTYRN